MPLNVPIFYGLPVNTPVISVETPALWLNTPGPVYSSRFLFSLALALLICEHNIQKHTKEKVGDVLIIFLAQNPYNFVISIKC